MDLWTDTIWKCQGIYSGRTARRSRIRLQSRLKPERKHEICHGIRMHPHEADSGTVLQRMYDQFRICNGGKRHPRFHNQRQKGKSDNYKADSIFSIHSIQSSDSDNRKSPALLAGLFLCHSVHGGHLTRPPCTHMCHWRSVLHFVVHRGMQK